MVKKSLCLGVPSEMYIISLSNSLFRSKERSWTIHLKGFRHIFLRIIILHTGCWKEFTLYENSLSASKIMRKNSSSLMKQVYFFKFVNLNRIWHFSVLKLFLCSYWRKSFKTYSKTTEECDCLCNNKYQ